MGMARGTYGGEVRCIQGFDEETWGKETSSKTYMYTGGIQEIELGHGLF
jgi:hypothetical protein